MTLAGIEKRNVCYINGHGTGTGANDRMEDLAYMRVFKEYVDEIPMSSIKGSVGHCLGAAGAVECAVAVMALQHDMVPPTVHFDKPEKNRINHVPNRALNHKCDVVLSDSFAFGGNNCCIALSKPDFAFQGVPYEKKKIVITGIGCNGVGGENVEDLFDTFEKQKICIGEITEYETKLYKCKKAGIMPSVDYGKFMPSKILRRVDLITKLAIASGKQALDDSGLHVTQTNAGRIGVIYATATGPLDTIESINRSILVNGFDGVNPSDFPNSVINAAPGNFCIANMLKGPTSTISTGGTSSLIGFGYACELINSGQADAIVVIGADLNNEVMHLGNDKLSLLSQSDISPLCEGADGMILSQGSAAFVIETEEHAKMRGANIYAKVSGYSCTSDNEGLCTVNPEGKEYAECIRQALESSGLNHVDLLASGSVGNAKTDLCEINAMQKVFDKKTYLSNVQALIGSTSGCVGMYGILSVIYAFQKGVVLSLPDEAKGEIRKDLPVNYKKGLNQRADIRTACVDAISYGGGYTSVVLERY
jgi:3-oxoacyl-[acyl-carrier-protein] synthase II